MWFGYNDPSQKPERSNAVSVNPDRRLISSKRYHVSILHYYAHEKSCVDCTGMCVKNPVNAAVNVNVSIIVLANWRENARIN